MEFREFIKDVKKVSSNRTHSINNSYGTKDSFSYYRNNRPQTKEYVLTDIQYLSIIRHVNNHLRNNLINGKDVKLPSKMGVLELRKSNAGVKFKNGKLKTNRPVDWDATLKLWFEDEESKENKTLIRQEVKEVFKVYYNKAKANYNNKSFYEFSTNREIKVGLKKKIKDNKIDAFGYGIQLY